MSFDLALIIAGILIAVVMIFLLKDIVKIIINSILGLLLLFFINYFDLLGYVGRPDIPYTPVNILLCALGGIPGALIVIILQLTGISIT
ncbi:MAG TPA: pro-sigmaK processing inhibitor BofA family protein [Methanoregulaceae archaeon]|jgi:inhibitor of the pro-sigma K processing machinery|nr:pro-sigmaK processing inhibitor BofA family protein [Methanoregulaceae archaeon]HNJ80278.1 pro-sigmaK processing inhibitor BofA family protein [Methanoregulaceae archaeon]HNO08487.1 pro-sigmaK processing inhibitor BofA family protein [Methanoregulaceae archaeon]HOU80696.1 pro-sigmaK processing inhibitor BofA family protein [Methanoregulaceae archaeon]HPS22889.1 pro-sigmaK processing inhibitor BofA family protein [Methanoregulaceae archaeon]